MRGTNLRSDRKLTEWRKITITTILSMMCIGSSYAITLYWDFSLMSELFLVIEGSIAFICSIALTLIAGVSSKMPLLLISSLFSSASIGIPALMTEIHTSNKIPWENIGIGACFLSVILILYSLRVIWISRCQIESIQGI